MNNHDQKEALKADNARRLQALDTDHGIQIPSESLAQLQQNMMQVEIFRAVVPEPAQTKMHLKFEQLVSRQIDSIEAQVEEMLAEQRRSVLTEGLPFAAPKLDLRKLNGG